MQPDGTIYMNRATFLRLQLLIGSALAATMMISAPAFAADAVSTVAPAPDGDSAPIPEIVVTATKRETNLQKTPIAISVVSPMVIADRHVQSLMDLADGAVPSLRIATFEARQSALTVGIRGIVPFDATRSTFAFGPGA